MLARASIGAKHRKYVLLPRHAPDVEEHTKGTTAAGTEGGLGLEVATWDDFRQQRVEAEKAPVCWTTSEHRDKRDADVKCAAEALARTRWKKRANRGQHQRSCG